MPIKNNYVEASELIRRKRLSTIYLANTAAEARKFRALTRFSSYDPSVGATNVKATAEVCNDQCRTDEKPHNIFGAIQISASKDAHFNH
jgi:hypothetical protein